MTGIEWTDATWNPVTGCSKVSPGCAHCYAETLSLRYGWSKKPWTPENAAENVVLHPDRLDQPLRWRQPRMVFVNSMSDLFHEQVPVDFIAEIFDRMACATLDCRHTRWTQHDEECWMGPSHVFQVLTKRPERARQILSEELPWYVGECMRGDRALPLSMEIGQWPLPNVWLGVSVENQRWADERIPLLLDTPAAVRFLSCEPLLGPVTFRWRPWVPLVNSRHLDAIRGIDWIIVGGESGPTHRPMEADWARTIRDQAVEAGVAFFFKQWGGRTPKAGGKELDGREWCDYPVQAVAA